MRYFFLFLVILSFAGFTEKQPRLVSKPHFHEGERIVFLGNTFADRMRYYGHFEMFLQQSFADKRLSVRNMGWSADEVNLQPRPLNFVDRDDELRRLKADKIFLFFGMNESFKGPDSVASYKIHLGNLIDDLRSNSYNGKKPPELILVSPIAHEKLGGHMPDPAEHNMSLKLYTEAMAEVAMSRNIFFLNLFTPSYEAMERRQGNPLTINGIHLTDEGYLHAAKWMSELLGISTNAISRKADEGKLDDLKEVIRLKDEHFLYRWRAVNGEYIYGRRKEPFGIHSFPPEIAMLDDFLVRLDEIIWRMASGKEKEGLKKALAIVDKRSKPVPAPKLAEAGTDQFSVPENFEVNLFASEKDFPIQKPVAMAFDKRGRLWVATMPTYPQHYPGFLPQDKIVILEDTDGDGRADKHTVFADNLYLPLGFEFANGGVFVSQEPDIFFLKDTDGDDVADLREVVLMGFGSEDSHHATHAFTYGQDGALYFNEGTFLNSQIETPYGPVRSVDGTTFRYEPRTQKLDAYISYPYLNPWGNVFDQWGQHYIGDASDGSNYLATPMRGRIDYPHKHPMLNSFTSTRVRPTAGLEIVSSRNFPSHMQGNLLINNTIGFQGIKQHKLIDKGAGLTTEEVENLLISSDPNFRPVDLKFGPDGALFVADWYNPLIGHMQHSLRDPDRDIAHGRIWRIRYKGQALLKPEDLTSLHIAGLLDRLKDYEDRTRYRSRAAIREHSQEKVFPELKKWLEKEGRDDKTLLEGLWIHQDFQILNRPLLKRLLGSDNEHVRAAAVRVLFYWRDRVPEALDLLSRAMDDSSPKVRIEALVGLSYFDPKDALPAVRKVFDHPMDYYMEYAANETLRYLDPEWKPQSLGKEQEEPVVEAGRLEVHIAAVPSKMIFDRDTIEIPAGKEISLIFENPDEMPHNLLILSPGSFEKVGKAADEMMSQPDGFEKHFVPEMPEVLFATPLINRHETFVLKFKAPEAPGDYPFICSFPGHWRMMKGIVKVI